MIINPADRLIFREPIGTVAFPAGGWAVPPHFARCWGKMVAHNYENLLEPNQFVHLDDEPTTYHSAARNALAKRFMGDWLIQFDTDHEFEPDIVSRMVRLVWKWDVDVLTAVYRYRVPPYFPNLFWWDDTTQAFVKIASMDWDVPLTEIKCSGAGCLLVRRKVFDRIREELKEEPFDIIHPYSEDFSFYRRCMKLGIKTYVAPRIYSSHLVVNAITHEHFNGANVQTEALQVNATR
jgi:hypothetical protein